MHNELEILILSHNLKIDVPYHIRTVHHHHIQKYPVYKKVAVPVYKEVKVPYPVHYPVKVPYPVIVKPYVVTVPVHHNPIHNEQHIQHNDYSSDYESGEYGGSFKGNGFQSFGSSSQWK